MIERSRVIRMYLDDDQEIALELAEGHRVVEMRAVAGGAAVVVNIPIEDCKDMLHNFLEALEDAE